MLSAKFQLLFMTEHELDQLRREKWRLNGRPVRTLDDARAFIESVGFCMMYPMRPPLLAPTFIGAWAGSDERLPTWQRAFADPRAQEATDLMVRLLRQHAAYEANLFDENNAFLVAASIFLCFGGRAQSQAGSQARPAFGILAVSLRRVRTHPPRRPHLETEDAGSIGREHLFRSPRSCPRRTVVQAAHHSRGLQSRRRLVLGCPLPLVPRRG